MEIPTAFRGQNSLTRPRSWEIVAPGFRPRIQMVPCIFMIQGGCVTNLESPQPSVATNSAIEEVVY